MGVHIAVKARQPKEVKSHANSHLQVRGSMMQRLCCLICCVTDRCVALNLSARSSQIFATYSSNWAASNSDVDPLSFRALLAADPSPPRELMPIGKRMRWEPQLLSEL